MTFALCLNALAQQQLHLTIDEEGMAKTAPRKVEVAKRLHDFYTNKWGLQSCDMMIDVLTFTIATGMEADRKLALETLDAIETISKELPECGLFLGVSNVSFGLKPAASRVLNSVFPCTKQFTEDLHQQLCMHQRFFRNTEVPEDHWDAAIDLIMTIVTEARSTHSFLVAL